MPPHTTELAKGSPTKAFFAEMLTRDIELKDAVLDLLDNCVDGLMRTSGHAKLNRANPYSGYWAKLTFSRDKFVIEDNCGGIDRRLARESAFRMGRDPQYRYKDRDLPTVGTYGIGMKRAIFKIGRSAVVTSKTGTDAFKVVIPPTWFTDEKSWDLEMTTIKGSSHEAGTRIEVTDIQPTIAKQFALNADFELEFTSMVSEQFALIMKKGFTITVNGKRVKPKPFRMMSVDLSVYKGGIAPFLFSGLIDGVQIDLSVGFYKPLPDPNANDEEDDDAGTFTADESGWTVICNDRVILPHDTTHLTGWGISGVPSFHNQFIAIAGMVQFSAKNASLLPLTTTKRGVDLNSEIYQRVRDKMQEGTKFFTSYTNHLKKDPELRQKIFKGTDTVEVSQIRNVAESAELRWKTDRKLQGGRTFTPDLPETKSDNLRVIRFLRSKEEVSAVAELLFEDASVAPKDVGAACFDHFLKRVTK